MIQKIQSLLGRSNISVSKKFPKEVQKSLKGMSKVNRLAYKNDLNIRFSPALSGDVNKINMEVSKSRISHVTEVPEIAMKLNTGDSAYIHWEEALHNSEVPKRTVPILDTLMRIISSSN